MKNSGGNRTSGAVFMSGGITYDGHIPMPGITELELCPSENEFSMFWSTYVPNVMLLDKYAQYHPNWSLSSSTRLTIGERVNTNFQMGPAQAQ